MKGGMQSMIAGCVAVLMGSAAMGDVVLFSQSPNPAGGLYQSSTWDPDGSDWDQYVWDNFTLSTSQAVTQIRWRGGYIYNASYGGHISDFTVEIYPSIAAGSQPDVTHPPLVRYHTNGPAGEAAAGVYGGAAMYDYVFTLPSPFQATGGVKYWVQIQGYQHGVPDWALASASNGDGSHFRKINDGTQYQSVPGNVAFTLMGSSAPSSTITATVAPAGSGSVTGAGSYPNGSTATLTATANAGFGFVNWTEGAATVSNSATYAFSVTTDRALVAHFTPAYTIATSSLPTFGGATTGGGVYNAGSTVTVTAAPEAGFVFTGWTWFGTPVSADSSYTFTADMDVALTANFEPAAGGVLFDFDTAPGYTSLPIDVTTGGITAHLSATGSGFSIQRADTMGFTPQHFGGMCIYPNSVFAADLNVGFSRLLTGFSILYSPQELGCDTSATMRVTAYRSGVQVGTATATAPAPGTWPTGTLRITTAQPFDSVTVHYASRPPTCQDWGPIFLADNMIATPVPCPADFDGNGLIEPADIAVFVNAWLADLNAGTLSADFDHSGVVEPADIAAFVNAWLGALTNGC